MSVDAFCGQGWSDHATDAAGVFARLPEGLALAESGADLAKLCGLAVHVAGEHLGRWAEGIVFMERLRVNPAYDEGTPEGKAVLRALAALHACAGDAETAERFTLWALSGRGVPEASDRGRVQALVATSLNGQGRMEEAARAFEAALAHAAYGPANDDPLARMLAVSGNNLAAALEERADRSAADDALMVRAAEAGRTFWGIAGGWMEAERAEYRLAMSCMAARLPERAVKHASECLRIVVENGSVPGELFFAHEVSARAQFAAKDVGSAHGSLALARAAPAMIPEDGFRSYCAGELAKLEARLEA